MLVVNIVVTDICFILFIYLNVRIESMYWKKQHILYHII